MTMTLQERIEDIQSEIGETSSETMELIGHLTSAESCETIEDLRQNLLEARYSAEMILSQINDELSRI